MKLALRGGTASVSREPIVSSIPSLAFFGRIGKGQYILKLSQASDGKPNHLDHSEAEFVSQTLNETEVRVREPNSSGPQSVIAHALFLQHHKFNVFAPPQHVWQVDAITISKRYRLANYFRNHGQGATNIM